MDAKDEILTQFRDSESNGIRSNDEMARLFPSRPDVSSLTLTCRPGNYSAAVIARAVEDCDAHIVNLNITADRTDDGDIVIELRVTHANAGTVSRSLARYGYETVGIGNGMTPDMAIVARDRINELIHYLEI